MILYEGGIPIADECFLIILKENNDIRVNIYFKTIHKIKYLNNYYFKYNDDLFSEIVKLTNYLIKTLYINCEEFHETEEDAIEDIARYIDDNFEKEFYYDTLTH